MDFVEWIEHEMSLLKWKKADLARAGGLTPAQVTRVLTRQQAAGQEFRAGLARAFKIDVDEVDRRFRNMPKISERNERLKRIAAKVSQINDEKSLAIVENTVNILVPDKNEPDGSKAKSK